MNALRRLVRSDSGRFRNGRGSTMIELVISIVIISVALSAVTLLLSSTNRRSADPMVQQQASAIAQAYIKEILLNPFCDPNDAYAPADCPTMCVASACGACSGDTVEPAAQLETRATFDDVCDYGNDLPDTVVRDQLGNAIVGLENYSVQVDVLDDGSVDLDGLAATNGQALLLNVTVSHFAVDDVVISAYRANF